MQDFRSAKPLFCVAGGRGMAPPPLRDKTTVLVLKQQLWTLTYRFLLDLDTCLAEEAQNWTDSTVDYD